jgi:hypothetical protein
MFRLSVQRIYASVIEHDREATTFDIYVIAQLRRKCNGLIEILGARFPPGDSLRHSPA